MSNIKKVDSDDLDYKYFCLTNRRPDKNHSNDKEDVEGLGNFLNNPFIFKLISNIKRYLNTYAMKKVR